MCVHIASLGHVVIMESTDAIHYFGHGSMTVNCLPFRKGGGSVIVTTVT